MKNLKKTLCLVLAMVVVLGLCTVGTGASFADMDEIKYEEAVSILNGLGILIGFEDGNFKPGESVTREQAAKMIAYMMLGAEQAEKLVAKEVFDDVAATRWSAKFIYFCQNKGIINGYGDDTFGPADPVTGIQFAKMLLAAVGFGIMGEYTGPGWDVNVFVDAVSEGVYDEAETADYNLPANREEAALYLFNTLVGIRQVKYDVDMNKYDDYRSTFATTVWKLGITDPEPYYYTTIDPDTNREVSVLRPYTDYIVQENQDTGSVYTVVNGVNYAIDSELNLIGHAVIVYYRAVEKKDSQGKYFYEAYYIEDVSEEAVVSGMDYLGDVAKKVGYSETIFSEIPYWENYAITASDMADIYEADGSFNDSSIKKGFGLFSMIAFTKLKSDDRFIINPKGKIIAFLRNTSTVAKVKEVLSDSIVLENNNAFAGIYYIYDADKGVGKEDFYYNEAYEGIAKGDYVTIQQVGEKCFKLYPTTTDTVTIFQAGTNNDFNNSAIGRAAESKDGKVGGYNAIVNKELFDSGNDEEAEPIYPGYTVKFFYDYYGKYFAYDIVARGDSQGFVLLVDVYRRYVGSNYGGDDKAYYYAQCVDTAGNELNYLITEAQALTLNAGATTDQTADDVISTGIYEVINRTSKSVADGEYGTTYTVTEFSSALPPLSDKAFYIASKQFEGNDTKVNTRDYFNEDTTYIYTTGSKEDLKIEVAKTIGKFKDGVEVWYLKEEAGTINKVPTIWINAKAPLGMASSLIFVSYNMWSNTVYNVDPDTHACTTNAYRSYTDKSGSTLINGSRYYTFTPYIDGNSMMFTPIPIKAIEGDREFGYRVEEDDVWVDKYATSALSDGKILNGFYAYSIDANGLYSLTTTDVLSDSITLNKATNLIYQGTLSVDDTYSGNDYKFSAFDISEMKIVDISFATNDYTGKPLNIASVSDIANLIADGKNVGLTYAVTEDDDFGGKYVPYGVIYVTSVY